jgi:hypothetical protein
VAAAQGLFGAVGLATAGAVGLAAGSVYEHAGPRVLFTATGLVMMAFLGLAVVRGRDLLSAADGPESGRDVGADQTLGSTVTDSPA